MLLSGERSEDLILPTTIHYSLTTNLLRFGGVNLGNPHEFSTNYELPTMDSQRSHRCEISPFLYAKRSSLHAVFQLFCIDLPPVCLCLAIVLTHFRISAFSSNHWPSYSYTKNDHPILRFELSPNPIPTPYSLTFPITPFLLFLTNLTFTNFPFSGFLFEFSRCTIKYRSLLPLFPFSTRISAVSPINCSGISSPAQRPNPKYLGTPLHNFIIYSICILAAAVPPASKSWKRAFSQKPVSLASSTSPRSPHQSRRGSHDDISSDSRPIQPVLD